MTWEWFTAEHYSAARFAVQRLVALLYLLAFTCALRQFRGLLGQHGLTPIPRYLATTDFRSSPSLFHWRYSDRGFAAVAWAGIALSSLALLGLTEILPVWASLLWWVLLWVLYLSIVNVGQIWYSFGWESLLLETGFLVALLGPAHVAAPAPVMWLLCWLLFRVEFGAGLIKIRGDPAWRDLTALHYHHETQPMPGPLSRWFHQMPKPLHRVEVLANHVTQLVVPFALFLPQPVAGAAALCIIVTQAWLMLSGNFAWLNALTLTLAVAALDDWWLGALVPVPQAASAPPVWFAALVVAATALIVVLSYWPVRNMLGRRQVMNRSFNAFHLGNTYGAFGSITRGRYEVVLEGTSDPEQGWSEYEFRGKPGDPQRRPPQIAPYHLRLDWLMWFCAIAPGYGRGWLPRLLGALLRNDRDVLGLLRHNPFPEEPPVLVRARLFHYRFTTREQRRSSGAWWVREPVGELVPPQTREDLAY
ncbi:lipase maturation factor family protein [Salinifilum ghardaiensis]